MQDLQVSVSFWNHVTNWSCGGHNFGHVHESSLCQTELCSIQCKKLVPEKSCTKKHMTHTQENNVKVSGTRFHSSAMLKLLVCQIRPSTSFPFPHLSLSIAFPSPLFPSLPLEVGPLKYCLGIWGNAISGADPQWKVNTVHFNLKIWHLVALWHQFY